MRRLNSRCAHRLLAFLFLLSFATIASAIQEDKLPDHWGFFAPTRAPARTKTWRTPVSIGEVFSTRRRFSLHRCSDGGWAVSPPSSDDIDNTPAPETTTTTTTTTMKTTSLERLVPTRQENLASGYTYFENIYMIEGQFVMIQKQGGAPLDPDSSWAPIDLDRQQERGGGDHVFEKRRWLGGRVWNEPSNVDEGCQQASNGTSSSNLGMIQIPGAVVISDLSPGFVPHLYHMAENLLGLWPTYEEYAGSRTPCWLVLPHNAGRELNPAVMALAEAIFPGMLVIDEDMLKHVAKKTALGFEWVVHADRSAADHGGVNQMIHGIFNHTRRHMASFVGRVFGNLGIISVPQQPTPHMAGEEHHHPTPRVSIIDRKSLTVRRLMHTIASALYSSLAGLGNFEVRVVLLEKLSLAEQAQAAARTNVLVGVSGNGLAHSLFMPSPGAVVEIIPRRGNGLITSQLFAELRGNAYFGINAAIGRQVHGEVGSCRPSLGEDLNGNLLDGCFSEGETFDSAIVGANASRIVCVVHGAIFSTGLMGYSWDDMCWSPCTQSRPAIGRNATCKYRGGVDYSCKDLKPYKVENRETQSPHAMCLSGRESWGTCGHGHFLCEAHVESDGILASIADEYFREWSLVDRSGIDLPGAPFARGGADLADATSCCEHHKLCVVVPFRDSCQSLSRSLEGERTEQLVTFKRYMRWFLTSVGHDDYDLIVVNQTDRGLFNRAVLINVGVDLAWKRGCDYISMHDVDLLPANVANDYGWPEIPVHQFSNSSNPAYGVHDFESCKCAAGVVMMQLRHYAQMHGMSNSYNGWGGEDSDLDERIRRVYGPVRRLDPRLGNYLSLAHGRNDETQLHPTTGRDAHSENVKTLERFKDSSNFDAMEQDGFRQLRKHARLRAVLEEGEGLHVVTALVDVLEGGDLQSKC